MDQCTAARRYFDTAHGAKIPIRTTHQTTDSQMLSPAGASSHKARIASTNVLTGLASATCSRPSGIDSTGTNAEEMKVIGKMSVKPMPFAASGVETERPMTAKIHDDAKTNSSSRP